MTSSSSLSGASELIGKRIKLIYTKDRYTKLRSGDTGTITDVTILPEGMEQRVSWDSGSRLAMMEGKDYF
jgi:Domain of unknown function (DUF4314)